MKFRLNYLFLCLSMQIFYSLDLHAFVSSVKSLGMGGVGAAYPQDAHAAAFNPAGAAKIGNTMDIGIIWNHYTGKSIVRNNKSLVFHNVNGHFNATQAKDFFSPDLGINKRLCLFGLPVSVGLVGYTKDFGKMSYKKPLPLFGTSDTGLELIRGETSAYIAAEFNPARFLKVCWIGKQAFGVSVNFIGQRFKASGLQNINNPLVTSHPGHVTNRRYNYTYGVGATVGWRGEFFYERLALGVAFTPEMRCGRFKKYDGFLANHGRFDVPPTILGGLAINWLPGKSTVAFDVEYAWNNVKALTNKGTVPSSPDTLFGASHGPGFGWKNQTIYRLGVDYKLLKNLTLRTGYSYRTELFSGSQNFSNSLSVEIIQHYFTLGASWMYRCMEFNMFYAYGFQLNKKGHNTIPEQQPYGGGDVNLKLIRNLVGVSVSYNY